MLGFYTLVGSQFADHLANEINTGLHYVKTHITTLQYLCSWLKCDFKKAISPFGANKLKCRVEVAHDLHRRFYTRGIFQLKPLFDTITFATYVSRDYVIIMYIYLAHHEEKSRKLKHKDDNRGPVSLLSVFFPISEYSYKLIRFLPISMIKFDNETGKYF